MRNFIILKSIITLLAISIFCLGGYSTAIADAGSSLNNAAINNHDAVANQTDKSIRTRALETGAKLLQDNTPVKQLETYIDGFHNYKSESSLPGENQHQMRVSHYCKNLNEDLIQCAVYDGNTKNAHLIGIEYVVSDQLYKSLPDDEKKYWHPHDSEVDNAIVIAPEVPEPAHTALMDKLRTTHGKTWHIWDTQKYQLPFGEPALMWSIESEQINTETKQKMASRNKSIQF